MNEDGFEYQGVFYAWHVTDTGKDLRLIDHFTGLPVKEFFETVGDTFDSGRGPILLALMATSVRHLRQEWSVERVARLIDGLSLSEVEFIEGGESDDDGPPASAGAGPADKPESSSTSATGPEASPEPRISGSLSGSPA